MLRKTRPFVKMKTAKWSWTAQEIDKSLSCICTCFAKLNNKAVLNYLSAGRRERELNLGCAHLKREHR